MTVTDVTLVSKLGHGCGKGFLSASVLPTWAREGACTGWGPVLQGEGAVLIFLGGKRQAEDLELCERILQKP